MNQIIPMKMIRYKDRTKKWVKKQLISNKNFEKPSESLKNDCAKPLEK